jgi:hypothetical protein
MTAKMSGLPRLFPRQLVDHPLVLAGLGTRRVNVVVQLSRSSQVQPTSHYG